MTTCSVARSVADSASGSAFNSKAQPAPAQPSIDELDRAICTLAGRINAATHDLLILIRRFDERGGWLRWGFESCAEWLAWRCDLSLSAAREKVRVAHALKTLPAIGRAFADGALSYSKVRALTRVAGPENEEALLEFARHTTAARVAERCRELRWGRESSTDEARRAQARRRLSLRRDPARGRVTITVELPLETGELIDKALDRALETTAFDAASTPELAGESWAAQRADALVALAKSYLDGKPDESGGAGTPDHYQVTVHVDQSALRGGAGRAGLPIASVRRLACDGDKVVLVEDDDGEPLSVGRKSRVVPAAIKRALYARDKGSCRFPGCGHTRWLSAHHIEHWAAGGETCLANLMLLCFRHHALVHEGGFTIEKDYRDRWFFRRPDGRAVPACGYRPEDMTDDDIDTVGEYFDKCPAAEVFADGHPAAEVRPSAEASMVREPSAEVYIGAPLRIFTIWAWSNLDRVAVDAIDERPARSPHTPPPAVPLPPGFADPRPAATFDTAIANPPSTPIDSPNVGKSRPLYRGSARRTELRRGVTAYNEMPLFVVDKQRR